MNSVGSALQIFDTPYWSVVLNPNQAYLGRSVILLKRKCGSLAKITQEELIDFLGIVQKMEELFRITFNATMFNWSCLMNNAYQETPPQPQVHWHFIPRYDHPVKFADKTFEDPNFGHRILPNVRNMTPEEIAKLIELLKQNLNQKDF